MVSGIRYREELVDDIQRLDAGQWSQIKAKIKEVKDQGLDHDKVKLIPNPDLKHPICELKVEEENTDHRVFLNIDSGSLVVLAIWDFDFTQQGEKHWEKLQERI